MYFHSNQFEDMASLHQGKSWSLQEKKIYHALVAAVLSLHFLNLKDQRKRSSNRFQIICFVERFSFLNTVAFLESRILHMIAKAIVGHTVASRCGGMRKSQMSWTVWGGCQGPPRLEWSM